MVAAEDEEILWVLDLIREEKANGLQRLLASVDVISEEQIVGFRWESTILEQTEEIIVLTMDVTTNLEMSKARIRSAVSRSIASKIIVRRS